MERVEPADLGPGRGGRAVDDAQVAPQRAVEAAPRVGPEVGVLGDAGRDRRVGDLQEQGARPGAEQQHRLAVEAPGLGAGAEQPGVAPSCVSTAVHDSATGARCEETPMGRWGTELRPGSARRASRRGCGRPTTGASRLRLFGLARPRAARAGPTCRGRARCRASLLLTRAAAGFARADWRLRAVRARTSAGRIGCSACPTTSTRTEVAPARAALVGRPSRDRARRPARPPARRSRTCTPRSTGCRATGSPTAGRLRGPRGRGPRPGSGRRPGRGSRGRVERTGRRSRDCYRESYRQLRDDLGAERRPGPSDRRAGGR